jgi:hypothetical protein
VGAGTTVTALFLAVPLDEAPGTTPDPLDGLRQAGSRAADTAGALRFVQI